MAPIDPYKLLQVDPQADAEIIQVAYRKLAQRYHPDIAAGPESARRMADLNAARDLLLDPARRAAFDRSRDARGGPASDSPTPGQRPPDSSGRGAESAAEQPPGNPSGSVLTFGRYTGWSLGEIARRDIEYLEWLDRMPIGRTYRAELDAILRKAGRREPGRREEPHGLFRRR